MGDSAGAGDSLGTPMSREPEADAGAELLTEPSADEPHPVIRATAETPATRTGVTLASEAT